MEELVYTLAAIMVGVLITVIGAWWITKED